MKKNILYILSSYNKLSGTPKKTFDLIKYSENNNFLYVFSAEYSNEFKSSFDTICKKVYEGDFARNVVKHVQKIVNIIDKDKIEIIQTQFFYGELLGGIVKMFRPKIKLVVSFEGSKSQGFIKRIIQKLIYKNVDAFIYISNYVKTEKEEVFPRLKMAKTKVIYNGTTKLKVEQSSIEIKKEGFRLLSVSSLITIKNIDILIDMMQLLVDDNHKDIHLFIAGDGAQRIELEKTVSVLKLKNQIHFLGQQKAIGNLLAVSDVLVHPCNIEGFGLSVVEAMMAEKPVVVANAGALPEIVAHKKTGVLVNPFKAIEWKNAILELKQNKECAAKIAKNGRIRAEQEFSIRSFVNNHQLFYQKL